MAGHPEDSGYISISIFGQRCKAHNLAWYYIHGVWTKIDHKDRNRSNNAIHNLRPATNQLNAANRQFIGNNSGAKGVYKKGNRYHAGIKVNQIRMHLGSFRTLEEAAKAYRDAAIKYFGEFANED